MAENEKDELMFSDFYAEPTGSPKKSSGSSSKAPADPTRTGQTWDAMNNYRQGTVIFRIIPDTVLTEVPGGHKIQRLYRKINNGLSIKIKGKDDQYHSDYKIPCKADFDIAKTALTAGQESLLEECRKGINNINEFLTWENRKKFPAVGDLVYKVKYDKQTVITYGKMLKYVNVDGKPSNEEEWGHVRVFKFNKGKIGSGDFISVMNTALSSKAAIFSGNDWKKDYFARKEGKYDKAIIMTVKRGTDSFGSYNLSLQLDSIAPFEITDEDLKVADNLNSRMFDVTKFDEQMYEKLKEKLDYVQGQINTLGNVA